MGISSAEYTLGLSPSGTYYDIHSYVADQHLVQVTLKIDAPLAALLDPKSTAAGRIHLRRGEALEATVAAACVLKQQNLGVPRTPLVFSPRGALNFVSETVAGSTRNSCILFNARKISPVFFEFGFSCAYLLDNEVLARTLRTVLEQRLKSAACYLSLKHDASRMSNFHVSSSILPAAISLEKNLRRYKLKWLSDPILSDLAGAPSLNVTGARQAATDSSGVGFGGTLQPDIIWENLTLSETKAIKQRDDALSTM